MPLPARITAGPIWSKNTNGPTMRRSMEGSARLTSKPPMSRLRGTTTVSTGPVAVGMGLDPMGRAWRCRRGRSR
jgi:hypothetical protein